MKPPLPDWADRKRPATLAQLVGARALPKAGLLATSGLTGAVRACQLIVE